MLHLHCFMKQNFQSLHQKDVSCYVMKHFKAAVQAQDVPVQVRNSKISQCGLKDVFCLYLCRFP